MKGHEQLRLVINEGGNEPSAAQIAEVFDPARMTQARHLAGITKTALAQQIGISAAAVGQWESSTTPPRADHLQKAAEALDVPVDFFALGRPYVAVDSAGAYFRSLRSTRVSQRQKAIAFVQQTWELAYALEKRVEYPHVDLPGFRGGEICHEEIPQNPQEAARYLREYWGIPEGPVPHVVREMENRGIIVTLTPFAGNDTARIDAFSVPRLPRPMVVLTPDRANNVYRHRFTAAHELGHLLLHGDVPSGDKAQESEADAFAAEFLTPAASMKKVLPARLDLNKLTELSRTWGVDLKSLIYRSRELGLFSGATARRAYQAVAKMEKLNLLAPEPISNYPGEVPCLLRMAFDLAQEQGVTHRGLAKELRWNISRLRLLLGEDDRRPKLQLVRS